MTDAVPVTRHLTESEVRFARYNQIEKEADGVGRLIGVRRLKPSEQTKLSGMTSELTGYDRVVNEKGEQVDVPHRAPLMLASSVCLIVDEAGVEVRIPFPANRAELDAIYDRLDIEGLIAAGKATERLNATNTPLLDPKEAAKNL